MTFKVSGRTTVTGIDPVLLQPIASVTVTVYTVLTRGDAHGIAISVALSPVAGDHEKIVPPLNAADSDTADPRHTAACGGVSATTGGA